MKIGVVFPQTEIGPDVGAVRAYGQCADQLGYHHVLAFGHVVGADPAIHRGWKGPYDVRTQLHEPFVRFGLLAGNASLHFTTGVLILPQRETVLVAKQAAELDLPSGGRLRLGVGVGWNPVEYVALGQDFAVRGARLDEQVDLLAQLWTQSSVTYQGRFDQVDGAGLWPLPIQRPIPLWLGGGSAPAYRRTGRLADGGFPIMAPGPSRQQRRQLWPTPRQRPDATPRAWAWRAGRTGTGTPTTWLSRRCAGEVQERPTSGSTR